MDPIELFLRGVWANIPSEDDLPWVEEEAREPVTTEPLGDHGALIKEMLDKGVSPHTIARFAKLSCYNLAVSLCYLLEDPGAAYQELDGTEDDDDIEWGLFLIDPDTGKPTEPITSLHESILAMDPSGREMRPKDA